MVSSILKVGTQLEIKVAQQAARAEKEGEKPRVLRSMIYDIKDNGDLEISMPVEGGRLILLALAVRYELIFTTKGGRYRSIGQVKERYKSGNLYMAVIELKESLSKCQRREYYRMECLLNIEYMKLTPEEMQLETEEEILKYHIENFPLDFMQTATAVDVSAGGMRFIAEEALEVPSNILVKLPIGSGEIEGEENEEKEMYLRGEILSEKLLEYSTRRHEYRVKFILENGPVREEIVRYIFEEQRKGRNIKKG